MTDLVTRLRAAIDETEQVAREAGGAAWVRTTTYPDQAGVEEAATGEVVVYDEGWPTTAQAEHIARQNPQVTLRRCAGVRKILDLHGPDLWSRYSPPDRRKCVVCLTNRYGYSDDWEPDPWPCPTLLALAEAYSVEV